jgi:tetratricopeptide (TPR) repeat protein
MKLTSNINKTYFLAIISIGLMMTSCKKLIEIPSNPSNQLSAGRVFADSANIIAAVSGVYSNFATTSSYPQFGSGLITITTGLAGDELALGSETSGATDFYNNMILPDNSYVRSLWADAYKNIFQINICLEGIQGTTAISAKLKNQLIGELKVDRALYYYHMINIWGAVPIITSTDYKITQHIPRSSVAEVFDFILSDLNDAQQKLTIIYPSAGRKRPNLHVAQALLSKVYLYLGRYQDAINSANNVIASPLYTLEDLNAVFLSGSKEAIWQLPADGTFQQTPEGASFIPFTLNDQPSYVLSPKLLQAFEPNDPRLTNWIGVSTVGSTQFYFPYKYKNNSPDQAPVEDYMVLRLADIYLVRAEAFANLEKYPEAMADLNKIRDRAADRVDVSTNVKAVALSAILHERQVELFCEWGNRWIDLKRTNTINMVLNAEKPSWKASSALFPIPANERQANPSLNQNPGY